MLLFQLTFWKKVINMLHSKDRIILYICIPCLFILFGTGLLSKIKQNSTDIVIDDYPLILGHTTLQNLLDAGFTCLPEENGKAVTHLEAKHRTIASFCLMKDTQNYGTIVFGNLTYEKLPLKECVVLIYTADNTTPGLFFGGKNFKGMEVQQIKKIFPKLIISQQEGYVPLQEKKLYITFRFDKNGAAESIDIRYMDSEANEGRQGILEGTITHFIKTFLSF